MELNSSPGPVVSTELQLQDRVQEILLYRWSTLGLKQSLKPFKVEEPFLGFLLLPCSKKKLTLFILWVSARKRVTLKDKVS